MNMRVVLSAVCAVVAMAMMNGCTCPMKAHCAKTAGQKKGITFDNASFYGKDGTFDVEKGKDAVLALAAYHGYPVFPGMREKLWVSDYSTGQFMKLGLAAYMFKNNEDDRYMLMDLFLMPGQMLPEHYHLKSAKSVEKMEGWLVRLIRGA